MLITVRNVLPGTSLASSVVGQYMESRKCVFHDAQNSKGQECLVHTGVNGHFCSHRGRQILVSGDWKCITLEAKIAFAVVVALKVLRRGFFPG